MAELLAWIYEDTLPLEYPYDAMFQHSQVRDGVRMFPVFGPREECRAVQHSDQMVCDCGNRWDANDPAPPTCGVRVDDAPQPGAYVAHAQEVRKLLEGEAPPDFCDGHCTWLDHHPDCPRARGVKEGGDADHE